MIIQLLVSCNAACITLILLNFYCRRKTKAMSFKPEMTKDEEEGKNASPVIPHIQHGQADCKVVENESVEWIPLQAHNESQGEHSYLFTLMDIFLWIQNATTIIT